MVSGVNECINTWYTNPGSFKPGLSDRSCWMKRENSLNETSLAINNFLSQVFCYFSGKHGKETHWIDKWRIFTLDLTVLKLSLSSGMVIVCGGYLPWRCLTFSWGFTSWNDWKHWSLAAGISKNNSWTQDVLSISNEGHVVWGSTFVYTCSLQLKQVWPIEEENNI